MTDSAIDSTPNATHWYLDENPLLQSIPKFSDPCQFAARLAYSPLSGLAVSQLDFMSRHELLVGEKMPLQPTPQSLRVALTWYGMLRVSYQVRNPVRAEARQRYWDVLNRVANGATCLPAAPVSGISVQLTKGPTGTAKTVTAKRFCEMLGPQCVDHGPRPDAGWTELKQLVYLYTDLSHDGTRGGFLISLLLHMDRVLGTHYADDLPKRHKTIERLAVATVGRLIAHFTGIVFIDEGQLRNLMLSDQADLMQLFLLSLMNSGIPLVMIGNERAFDWIDFSQDRSRLNVVPAEYFHPVGAIDTENSEIDADALFRGISSYYVLEVLPRNLRRCKRLLLRLCGGIARLGLMLWCDAQITALQQGRNRISEHDLIAAYHHRRFDELRPLADGFAKRLPELLMLFPDVDVYYYATQWGIELHRPEITAASDPADTAGSSRRRGRPGSPGRRQTGKEKFKAEQTRKATAKAAREKLLAGLDPDDIRSAGITEVLLAGLSALREKATDSPGGKPQRG